MIELQYPDLLKLFREHIDPDRTESASFLIWYLERYYRLDSTEAIDAVCDQPGDKGVDGIFVNESDQTITIFQSKISQKAVSTIGDAHLRSFAGTLQQFESPATVTHLAKTAAPQLAALIKRLDLENKVLTYELRGEFLANIDLDRNGIDYLRANDTIVFIGKSELKSTYISDQRNPPKHAPATFSVGQGEATRITIDGKLRAVLAPIKASELTGIEGIADQGLFAFNVRGPLGRTNVNKEIVKSIRDKDRHKLFPLFHNGITVIAQSVALGKEAISIEDYYVVNGCQSLTSLYNNASFLSDDLRVLVKFIALDPKSAEAGMITQFSNNQNGVKSRDFRSNNQIQIRLHNEMESLYAGEYAYEIKRGEPAGEGIVISNEMAGLYLLAFDLQEPWSTHQKYSLFEDRHSQIFGRPSVTADHIVMCQVIAEVIDDQLHKLKNQLFAKYALTKYMTMSVIRQILDKDSIAKDLFKNPAKFVRSTDDRDAFRACVDTIMSDIVIDLNGEIEAQGATNFDYRDKLRSPSWVRKLTADVVGSYEKLLARERINSFGEEWNGRYQKPT